MDKSVIEKLVRDEELNSFRTFIAKNNLTEEILLKDATQHFKGILEDRKSFLENTIKSKNLDNHFAPGVFDIDKVNSPESYFDYFKHINKYYKESCIKTLCKISSAFRAVDFFGKDFESQFTNVESLEAFLLDIPIINTFGSVIDQNVFIEYLDKRYTVIRNYFLYDAYVTTCITPLIVNSMLKIQKRGSNEQPPSFNSTKVAEWFNFCGETYIEDKTYGSDFWDVISSNSEFELNNSNVQMLGRDIYYGMQFFSFFHEYAHIICGHFDSEKSNFQKEIEADIFAINALIDNSYYEEPEIKGHVIDTVRMLRVVSALLYFVMKIAFTKKGERTTPSYFTRFLNIRAIIETYYYLNDKFDFVAQIIDNFEDILLEVIKLKDIDIESMWKVYNGEFEKIDSLKIRMIIHDSKLGLFPLKFVNQLQFNNTYSHLIK